MQRAVHRRAGAFEDADHGERLVVMPYQADGADAVGQHDALAEPVVQRLGHFGAEHHVEQVPAERAALGEAQRLSAAVAIVLEIAGVGAHHPVTAMGVAEGDRDRPFHQRALRHRLVAVPADVVGGVADAEHRIEQQVHRAGAGADYQVGAADGAGEAGAGFAAHPFDGQQQAHREGDGEDREQRGEASVGEAGERQAQQMHVRFPRGARRGSGRPGTGCGRTAPPGSGRG
ncbi:hypothetical protein D9M71_504110 [compost metagenome]